MARDTGGQATNDDLDNAFITQRASTLDLGGEYIIPDQDPISLLGSGFAKTMASNIYLAGLEPEFCAQNTGYFTAPFEDRKYVTGYELDRSTGSIQVSLSNGITRTARIFKSQGAITLPLDSRELHFEPSTVKANPAQQTSCNWYAKEPIPANIDSVLLDKAMNIAFEKEAMTAAFLVTYKGKIISETYGDGISEDTPLESWSMGKSLTCTMLGQLVQQGVYSLDQPAPIPGWENDARSEISIRHILNMSSGLRFRAMQDPGYEAELGYPDHLYVYTGGINAFQFAAQCKQQWQPGTVGRYRNCDPILANYLIRLAVEEKNEDYHSFPQRTLFDKLAIGSFTLETDPYGNFLTQGYEFGSARDWAKLGNLYLGDGIWNNERLLPEGWADFVSTLAPAWLKDKRPVYGGFFWINGDGQIPIPNDAYFMAGAGGQRTIIIPSHDLVIVRIGHYGGAVAGATSLNKVLNCIMRAVPPS
ncbi:MAG: serine hydrolase [Pseudomonadales bacterium]